jgi:uncharacterized protein (TIGR02996 family)
LTPRAGPHDDAPRLVLADWLDDHGEHDRAEFVRLQLRLAPGPQPLEAGERKGLERRCRQLLDRRGGCWLGGLWRWFPPATCWHRGLLALRVPRRYDSSVVEEAAGWVDSMLFRLTGRESLRRAAELLSRTGVNHAGLDLRNVLREQALLAELVLVPALPNLRSLTLDWPQHPQRPVEGGARPLVGADFLAGLLSLPFARHLTHLASSWPFDDSQAEAVNSAGVKPVHARHATWMHDVDPPSSTSPDRKSATSDEVAGAAMGVVRQTRLSWPPVLPTNRTVEPAPPAPLTRQRRPG